MSETQIRAYERSDLSLEQRLPSLARRFPCLKEAVGIDPWNHSLFHEWVSGQGIDNSAYHAGHFILNLTGQGPWDNFDILEAARIWGESDRRAFISWFKVWRF